MAEKKSTCVHCRRHPVVYFWKDLCAACDDKYRALMQKYEKHCQHCGDPRGRMPWKCDPCLEFHMPDWVKRGREKRRANRMAKIGADFPIATTPEQKRWMFYTHGVVSRAIENGLLPRLDGSIACVDCGIRAAHYDHRDYARPLDVDPVCASCNVRRGPGRIPEPRTFAPYVEQQEAA